MRSFLAIDPDPAARAELEATQARLRSALPAARWSKPEGIHLTLRFLGEISTETAAAIAALVAEQAVATRPFELALAPLGAFPSPARPRVLWAGVAGDVAALARVKTSLDDGLERLGFAPEPRPWRPHLTLARLPGASGDAAAALAATAIAAVRWRVRELVLYRSLPGPGGMRYEPLARSPFVG